MSHIVFHRLRACALLLMAGAMTILPASAPARAAPVYLPGFPLLRQEHALTCESSAASMGTRARITESQLMAVIPRNPNPNLGFRGNPDGFTGKKLLDYGVYAAPLQKALTAFGYQSDVVLYGNDGQLKGYLNRGWPIVAWITYALRPSIPRLAQANGVQFVLVPGEHAVLIVGYDSGTVLANDPWTKQLVRYTWGSFNRSWGLFGNMGLAIQPCASPKPVDGVRVKAPSTGGVSWAWAPATNATRYRLLLTTGASNRRVLYSGEQTVTRFSYATPKPGHAYVLTVTSLSPCGAVSTGTSVWYFAPAVPVPTATSVATPVEATVTAVTPVTTRTSTGVPASTATGTVAVPPTALPTSIATPPRPTATPTR